MKTHRWSDMKRARFTPEQIAAGELRARAAVEEMNLRALREAAGKTQVELAAITEMTQSELSRFEHREDHRLSTLRRYVEALGGELEVTAIIDGQRVVLAGV